MNLDCWWTMQMDTTDRSSADTLRQIRSPCLLYRTLTISLSSSNNHKDLRAIKCRLSEANWRRSEMLFDRTKPSDYYKTVFFRFEQTQSAVLFRLIYVVWRMNSKLALNIQKNFQNASTTFHSVTFISVGSVFEVILKMFCSRLVLVRQHCIHKFLAERCVA